MKYVTFADLKLSQLMLGTVQFGLSYGIANKRGQPSYKEICEILACAYESDVNCLDTAAIYGQSEQILGKALADLGIADKMIVVSKVTHISNSIKSTGIVDSMIEQSVTQSLKKLRLDTLSLCLFHNEENFRYVDSLLKMKEKGFVKHIGCSVMTPIKCKEIINSGLMEAVQLPTNLLDRRFISAEIYSASHQKDIALFVRSIYLQGLLLLSDDETPSDLVEVIPVRRRLRVLAKEAGMSLAELAVRYVLSIKEVTCALVGVESVEQMKENIEIFSRGPLAPSLMKAISDTIPDIPEHIVTPNKWAKRMKDVKPLGAP